MAREKSLTSILLQAGFDNLERAKSILAELGEACPGMEAGDLVEKLARVADPDLALLALARLVAEAGEAGSGNAAGGGNSGAAGGFDLRQALARGQIGARTLGLLGASEFFGQYLATHPYLVADIEGAAGQALPDPRADILQALGATNLGSNENPMWMAGPDAQVADLRRAYYRHLALIAAQDLTSPNPLENFAPTGAALADLVDGALEGALALARRDKDPQGQVALAVIAMGKTGARELNYISDVDVIYVVGPGINPPTGEAGDLQLIRSGTALAAHLASICSGTGAEPPLWTLDAALRPEGKDGALVRTLESHLDYYQRWAKSWEFQALLKARPAAGDKALGQAYWEGTNPLVWRAVENEGFVEDARAMRRRVESHIPAKQAERELKLAPGGLRDVEFTVQLLQLVHGRVGPELRVRPTLEALAALSRGGYIGRAQAEEMTRCYQALRTLEHRTQLFRMQRTHLLPTSAADLRRIGRSIDPEKLGEAQALEEWWQDIKYRVRALHEEIYYRPLLPAAAGLSVDEAALSPEAASERLRAIGYRDPKGALHHITALTEGLSRRAAIQRQLLPVLLGWFADGADPDAGLLGFRQVSEALGDSHWYLRMLRDSGEAARRLTKLLSAAPLVATALPANPEAVAWLDGTEELVPKTRTELEDEIRAVLRRHEDKDEAARRLVALRGRELMRCAMVDVLEGMEPARSTAYLTPAGEATLAGALHIVLREAWRDHAVMTNFDASAGLLTTGPHAQHLIVAMGRLGGAESGYASDADVVFLYRPVKTGSEEAELAAKEARTVAAGVKALLERPGLGNWEVDTALRPEGKNGPLTRTLDSFQDYLARWALAWERQALLRARPIVGPEDLQADYLQVIDRVRYGQVPDANELKDIRRLKARMEVERMPRGQKPALNVKLGPGGLSDVEWTVQLLQLRHAAEFAPLRVTGTRDALRAALEAGLLSAKQTQTLEHAWMLASRIRAANVVGLGRMSGAKLDQVPVGADLKIVGQLLGYAPGAEHDLTEDWMRAGRQARAIVEEVFFG